MTYWIHSLLMEQKKQPYSCAQNKPIGSHRMKQNADFQEGILQAQSTATPLPTPKVLTINESFKMRYYKRVCLKGHQNG